MFKAPTVSPISWYGSRYTVIDLETTIRNVGEDSIGKQSASPYHPDNKIHLYGSMVPQDMSTLAKDSFFEEQNRHKSRRSCDLANDLFHSDILVAQNAKFDLLYLLMHHKQTLMSFLRSGGILWDTMQAEYLLTNQQQQFAPLGSKYKKWVDEEGNKCQTQTRKGMAEKYGGVDKDDRIAEYWNEGVDTPYIPENELVEYLDGDLKNTAIVFREQFKLAMTRGHAFMNLIQTQMQAIIGTTFSEYNGMRFDVTIAGDEAVVMAEEHDKLETILSNFMVDELNIHSEAMDPMIEPEDVNPGSVMQLSTMFFGGEFTHRKMQQQTDDFGALMFLKSGPNKGGKKMKYHQFVSTVDHATSLGFGHTSGLETNSNGYVMDDAACQKIIDSVGASTTSGVFLKHVLKYRKLGKDLKTYYIGLMNLTWPTDGCIHGAMNHCTTGTGRLSSSAPNMQNVSGGD